MEKIKPKRVLKNWGYELWIHNDVDYCGKLLVFTSEGNKFSMHYHIKKDETWYVQQGGFRFEWIDSAEGTINYSVLAIGDVVEIKKGMPHQLTALVDNSIIFEVSTQHFEDDSYRIYRDSPSDLIK